ncbi:MAG: alpha/beta hydrolase [Myxococcota bacterium]
MPSFTRDEVTLEYTIVEPNQDSAILLIAPGGMRSAAAQWSKKPWNPLDDLKGHTKVAMDQRNAGASKAPVRPGDGWASYTADQIALLDHLELEHVHIIGMCIGGSYAYGLMKAIPERIRSAVLFQPIGLDNNRHLFIELFDQWAADIKSDHPEADEDTWLAFREAMFGGDFIFNTTREEVAACQTPLLVLMGDDPYHPSSISRELAELAPRATLIEQWKTQPHQDDAVARIQAFLDEHR